jgi:hypothetical protein
MGWRHSSHIDCSHICRAQRRHLLPCKYVPCCVTAPTAPVQQSVFLQYAHRTSPTICASRICQRTVVSCPRIRPLMEHMILHTQPVHAHHCTASWTCSAYQCCIFCSLSSHTRSVWPRVCTCTRMFIRMVYVCVVEDTCDRPHR